MVGAWTNPQPWCVPADTARVGRGNTRRPPTAAGADYSARRAALPQEGGTNPVLFRGGRQVCVQLASPASGPDPNRMASGSQSRPLSCPSGASSVASAVRSKCVASAATRDKAGGMPTLSRTPITEPGKRLSPAAATRKPGPRAWSRATSCSGSMAATGCSEARSLCASRPAVFPRPTLPPTSPEPGRRSAHRRPSP